MKLEVERQPERFDSGLGWRRLSELTLENVEALLRDLADKGLAATA